MCRCPPPSTLAAFVLTQLRLSTDNAHIRHVLARSPHLLAMNRPFQFNLKWLFLATFLAAVIVTVWIHVPHFVIIFTLMMWSIAAAGVCSILLTAASPSPHDLARRSKERETHRNASGSDSSRRTESNL
jgi:hypothetical protein